MDRRSEGRRYRFSRNAAAELTCVETQPLERRRYQERPERYEYVLTEKGRGLWKVMLLLALWGDEHYPAKGGRVRINRHRGCGGDIDNRFHCERCGKELEREDLELVLGPALIPAANAGLRYPWRQPVGAL
jgi:hypothetical protein